MLVSPGLNQIQRPCQVLPSLKASVIHAPGSTQLPERKSGHCTSQQGLGSSGCPGRARGADQDTAFLLSISFKAFGNVSQYLLWIHGGCFGNLVVD